MSGRIQPGDRLVLFAFGAGFTSGAAAITWTADPAHSERSRDVAPVASVRAPLDWDSVDPMPPRLAAVLAEPGGPPVPARRRRARRARAPGADEGGGRAMIDLSGKVRRRDGWLARHRPRHRPAPRGRRAPTSASATAATAPPPPRSWPPSRRMGRRALAVQADAADQESANALIEAALEAFGRIDILVNNAGITRDDLIMRMKPEDWADVIATNLSGAFYAIKAVTRPMLKARSGRIVNITSVSGQAGQMGQANYSSAKAGLIGLTKATARELASRGITCNAVAPGFIETELTAGLPEELLAELTGAHAAGPLRHRPRRSPPPSPSSSRTRPPSSPARSSPSMAAWS